MDRRHFIAAAGTAYLGGTADGGAASAVASANGVPGRSVAEFGIEPNADRDQSSGMQRAIDAIAAEGQPIFVPPGRYLVSKLKLPPATILRGLDRLSVFVNASAPFFLGKEIARLAVMGFAFQHPGGASDATVAAIDVAGRLNIGDGRPVLGLLELSDLDFGLRTNGLRFTLFQGQIAGVSIRGGAAMGIDARECGGLTVRHCSISNTAADGIFARSSQAPIIRLEGNTIEGAGGSGLRVVGNASICGNVLDGGAIGIRVGGADRVGYVLCTNNMIRNCGVGIAASNAPGGYATLTINMIVGAKKGAIRAIDGEKLVGKDLTQSSSESFPYLAVGGNVSV